MSRRTSTKYPVILLSVVVAALATATSPASAGYGEFSLMPTGWPLDDTEEVSNATLAKDIGFGSQIRSLADAIKIRFGAQVASADPSLNEIPSGEAKKADLSPVILLPGYGGSRLEAKWERKQEHFFCDSHADWQDLWINVKLLLPYMIDCLIDTMRLEFDATTNSTKNTDGVEVRVKDPDTISAVEYLNNLRISSFGYYAALIRKLIMGLGYKREVNIKGAPYDFRKAPNELGDYFAQLKETSEQMFERNNQPVTYICHSMGCNNILYFLQRQLQSWKDEHVKRVISVAAPWAGSISALRAVALGDNLGMPFLFDETKVIRVQRSLPSTIYLLPRVEAFAHVPLVISNTANKALVKPYMADDYRDFFESIKHPDGYRMWQNTKDLLGSLEAPGVEVWCLVGKGQKTLGRLEFEGEFPNSQRTELYDDGDGTVTLQSSKYCTHWAKEQTQPIYLKEFEVAHMDILKDAQVVQYIENILNSETPIKAPITDSIS